MAEQIIGLVLNGKVNAKTSQKYKNGDEHFFLFIICSGSTVLYKVEVKPQEWGAFQEGAVFNAKVNYSSYKDQVTFFLSN